MANAFDQFDGAPAPASNPFDQFGQSDAQPPASNAFDQFDKSTGEAVPFGSIGRGYAQTKQGLNALWYMMGGSTDEEFASAIANSQAELAKYPKSQEQQAFEEGVQNKDVGFWSSLINHPTAIPSMLLEGVPSIVASVPLFAGGGLAGGAVGGPVGAAIGTSLGVGVGAGSMDYGNSFVSYLAEKGVNINDPAAINAALKNKDLVNEAHWYAAKRAGISAAFNTVGAAVGGKVATRFFTPETKLLSTEGAKGIGAIGAVGSGTQAATTAAQELATTGEIDPSQVASDAFIAGLSNLVPMAAPGIAEKIARGKSKVRAENDVAGDTTGGVDAQGKPVADNTDPQVPTPDPVVNQVNLDNVRAMQAAVEATPIEKATPQEWHDILKQSTDGVRQIDPESVVPRSVFDSEEPVTKSEMLRTLEEQQLVVAEEPVPPRPVSEGDAVPAPLGAKVLNIAKETPPVAPQTAEVSPVVESTASSVEPFAKVATEDHTDSQGRKVLVVTKVEKPDVVAPVKSNWDETVVQRVQRYAADNGYEAVSWPQVEKGGATPPTTEAPVAGSAESKLNLNADDVQAVKRVAAERGADRVVIKARDKAGKSVRLRGVETKKFTRDSMGGSRKHADVKNGIAYSEEDILSGNARSQYKTQVGAMERAVQVLRELEPNFKLSKPMEIVATVGESQYYGDFQVTSDGRYLVRVHLDNHPTAESIYTTLWHEFGHALAYDKWGNVDHSLQQSIMDAFHAEIRKPIQDNPRMTLGQSELNRRVYVKILQQNIPESMPWAMMDVARVDPEQFAYHTSFAEYFAEAVAKWSTTSKTPLSIVDKFFASLHRQLQKLMGIFSQKFPGRRLEATPSIQTWLDDFVKNVRPQFSVGWFMQQAKSMMQNLRAMKRAGTPHVNPAPATPTTTYTRTALQKLFGGTGRLPPNAAAGIAYADKFHRSYKYMISMVQLAAMNKHITELQLYRETVRVMHQLRSMIVDRAVTTAKMWRRIGKTQMVALNAVIDDYMNMRYRTPQEIQQGIVRQPTAAEFDAITAKYNLSDRGKQVFTKVVTDFSFMLDQYRDLLMTAANKISDPMRAAARMQEIQRQITNMRKSPYFPAMRFGDYTLTVRDRAGRVVHFETFETERARNRAREMAEAKWPSQIFDHSVGILKEDVKPLLGMPPGLLDLVKDELNLSPTQLRAMEELRFELAPGQSFKHRFQHKDLTSGYSEDFLRAYANYMFHGSSYIARSRYVEPLETFIKAIRTQAEFMPDGTKRGMIANFLSQHLATIIEAKSDFVKLKGMIFHWALGFNPAAAALNLSQQYVSTLPFLASKFGDIHALGEITKAQLSLSTYYKNATLQGLTGQMERALAEGVRDGVLTEAMAPELAALSEGRNLGRYVGSNVAEKMWYDFTKMSASMFSATEAMNRRVTFRAAFNLAMKDSAHKHVVETVNSNQIDYTRLRNEGWSHEEASAYVTAADAVRTTQYEYADYAKPAFMRGKAGAIFVFKSFVQNTLFMLWNYPSAGVRSFLIMGFLGGLMGLPGAEDLTDIMKAVAYQFFGKDFDLEREARQFVHDVSDGKIDPGIMLHGISREGFGMPAALDYLGESVGLGDIPMPTLDRSGSIGLGQISPVDIGALFGPTKDQNAAVARGAQQAAGAAFGMTFALYQALTDTQHDVSDPQRWIRVMPTAMRNVVKAYSAYQTGELKSASGVPVQSFDPNDTEQMMEVLAMGLGYQPLSVTSQYDRMRAISEVKTFWQLRHDGLLRQAREAYLSGDKEEFERQKAAIQQYNRQLPPEFKAFSVTPDSLKQSIGNAAKMDYRASQGLPLTKQDAGLVKALDPLYPQVEVGRRTVK